MCESLNRIKGRSEPFTGYKVAIKVNNKYYSPFTGVQYEVGNVKATKSPSRVNTRKNALFVKNSEGDSPGLDDNVSIISGNYGWYHKLMYGRTSVFISRDSAENKRESFSNRYDLIKGKYVVLIMTISTSMCQGKALGYDIMAGKKILEINEIK